MIKVVCVLMAFFTIVTLFQAKIKLLGKILGSIVALLIALASNGANFMTESMYVLANLVVIMTTIHFRLRMKRFK